MTLAETLTALWREVLIEGKAAVEIAGQTSAVKQTRRQRLRTVEFHYGPYRITGIEQNRNTRSRWAELARQGKRIMQFSHGGSYIGNVCEGELTAYPAWKALGLPE